jgi:hypothetical protein
MVASVGMILVAARKGKIDAKDIALLGGNKFIYIGGFKLLKDTFHKTIKGDILKNAGDYSKKVGTNPNINVRKGNIILEGQGTFKGKTFETTLKAEDYLK